MLNTFVVFEVAVRSSELSIIIGQVRMHVLGKRSMKRLVQVVEDLQVMLCEYWPG